MTLAETVGASPLASLATASFPWALGCPHSRPKADGLQDAAAPQAAQATSGRSSVSSASRTGANFTS
eukprot:4213996-Pyramimonas_sp.AAC.1